MTERFCFDVQDSGEGPLKVLVLSNQVGEFKGLLREMGERSVEVESLEDLVAQDVEADLGSEEVGEVLGLCCSLEPDVPWNGSVCELVTGLDEVAMLKEIAKLELVMETKRLRDEGGR